MVWKVLAAWVIVASVVAFAAYALDKRRARRGGWRVSERTLHVIEFLGGWPGGFAAQRLLRHKNRKRSYQLVFWSIVLLHALILGVWIAFRMDLLHWG